jgi:hypothetical protein
MRANPIGIQANDACLRKRIHAMTETTIGLEQIEQEILAFEVSDETLETAAGTVREKVANYTLAACSGLSVCPG